MSARSRGRRARRPSGREARDGEAALDNLTHTLCGAALAKTRLGRLSPLAPLALLIGANLPDADAVVMLFGGDELARRAAYLVHHRGITHALLGLVVQAFLLAAAIRWCERGGRAAGAPPLPWRAHLLPAAFGLLTHPLLDFLNNYGVRPWLPFSTLRHFGDLVFIVDPWLWLLLGATAALAGPRRRAGHVAWGLLGAAALAVLLLHDRSPGFVKVAFPPLLLAVALLRARGVGVERPGRVVVAGAAGVAGYLALLLACGLRAEAAVRADPLRGATLRMRSPTVADPTRWAFAFDDGARLRWRTFDLAGREVASRAVDASGAHAPDGLATGADDPLVQLAWRQPAAAAMRSFARLPWGWSERRGDGGATVYLADGRYATRRDPDSWCVVRVDLSAEQVAAASR